MMRDNVKSPCKGCAERVLGCHSTCDKYVDWKKKVEEYNAKVNAEKKNTYEPKEFLFRKNKKER